MTIQTKNDDNTLTLIYDGECLLCNHCAKALRLRQTVGQLNLVDARTSEAIVSTAREKGYDLNEGIVVHYQGQWYHGTDAMHLLALLSSPIDGFNRLTAHIFKYRWTTCALYPIFKAIRSLLLWLRGTPKLT